MCRNQEKSNLFFWRERGVARQQTQRTNTSFPLAFDATFFGWHRELEVAEKSNLIADVPIHVRKHPPNDAVCS
jgi:hypothetical protein